MNIKVYISGATKNLTWRDGIYAVVMAGALFIVAVKGLVYFLNVAIFLTSLTIAFLYFYSRKARQNV